MEQDEQERQWAAVLEAGVRAQRIVPGCVAVGGTAAALYARHRVSIDTDHLLADLRERFEEVRETLEAAEGWRTARVRPPVLVLGSLLGVPVGYRQMRRVAPIETERIDTPAGPLTVPTLDEMIGMKAYLAYDRNATRDYLDFAALCSVATDERVIASLLRSDERYGSLQSASIALEIAKALADPRPYDLSEIDLSTYKGLAAPWRSWDRIGEICRRWGVRLGERLISENS